MTARLALILALALPAIALAQDVPDAGPAPDAAPQPDAAPAPEPESVEPEPPPRASSGIRGRVTDARTGEALIEATVKVLRGPQVTSVLTDVEGNFELPLPPGSYDLRIYYELYQGRVLKGVVVSEGAQTPLDVKLGADEGAVQEVVVEAKSDPRSEGAVLSERKRAVAVSDAVSAQEISRTPDSSASDAVKRVVSATVVDGKYVLLRGLGGRYSVALIGGVILPSPEPDEQAVPLDLFPTQLLANLTVLKTHTPELPGTFAGGALLIETNSYPADFELKLKVGFGVNSASTFQNGPTYSGGDLDFLGFDDGTRALPDRVPTTGPVVFTGSGPMTQQEIERIGESFENRWATRQKNLGPQLSFGATAGDTLRIGRGKLGYLGSISLARRVTVRDSQTARLAIDADSGMPVGRVEVFDQQLTTDGAQLGALGNVGWTPSPTVDFNLFSLYTHVGDSRTYQSQGEAEQSGLFRDATRLQFLERALSFTQLSGRFRRRSFHDLEVRFQGNVSLTTRAEPDTRDLVYLTNTASDAQLDLAPGSGTRFFSDLSDVGVGGGISSTARFGVARVGLGGSLQRSSRDFAARRFRYELNNTENSALLRLPPDRIFTPATIGVDGFLLEEKTLFPDAYDAGLTVGAVYASIDGEWLPRLRASAGARVEASSLTLVAGSPFATNTLTVEDVDRQTTDVLPSANLRYALSERSNLRAGYAYTLARPTFRELAAFQYFDFNRRRTVSGNPALVETRIHNVDLRWELFPGEGEVLAASAFFKQFVDPIESVVVSTQAGDLGFRNTDLARVVGAELEGRLGLGRFARSLRGLRVGANLTLLYSRIELGAGAEQSTNPDRPLSGVSPYVLNINAGWTVESIGFDVNVLYNLTGARISDVGFDRSPDTYEQAFHRLDLTLTQTLAESWKLKLALSNLLDQSVVLRQGDFDVLRYSSGVGGSASLEWSR